MQYVNIPNIKLEPDEQKELVDAVQMLYEHSRTYYREKYKKFREISFAEDCRNYDNTLLKLTTFNESPVNSNNSYKEDRPNIHIPFLKAIANFVIGKHYDAIFQPQFLRWIPLDEGDYKTADELTDAFQTMREQVGVDETEKQILNDLTWYGNCPVLITCDGRINAVNEQIEIYELQLNPQIIEMVMQQMSILPPEQQVITTVYPPIIRYYEEDQEVDNQKFSGLIVTDQQGNQLERFADEDQGLSAMDQFNQKLQLFQADSSQAKIVDVSIKSTETWLPDLPRPKILPLLNTYVTPPELNRNEDTFNWIYFDKKRTQEIVDDPGIIPENRNKLYKNGKIIGDESVVNTSGEDRVKPYYPSNYTGQEKVVDFKMAYFDHYRFKQSKDTNKILRNFIVCTVNDEILIKCLPNTSYTVQNDVKISKNPLIWATYDKRSNENVGSGPILDAYDVNKAANILVNYALDTYSRIGNTFAYISGVVQPQTFNGGATTLFAVDSQEMQRFGVTRVQDCVANMEIESAVPQTAFSLVTMLKDYMHSVSGADLPYFESAEPTATQVMTQASQATSLSNTTTKHICRVFKDIYTRMLDAAIDKGVVVENITYFDKQMGQYRARNFDFATLKGKKFVPKLANINPSYTKEYQSNFMKELLVTMVQTGDVDLRAIVKKDEVMRKMFKYKGIDDIDLIRDPQEAQEWKLMNDLKEQLFAAYLQSAEEKAKSEGNTATGAPAQAQQS